MANNKRKRRFNRFHLSLLIPILVLLGELFAAYVIFSKQLPSQEYLERLSRQYSENLTLVANQPTYQKDLKLAQERLNHTFSFILTYPTKELLYANLEALINQYLGEQGPNLLLSFEPLSFESLDYDLVKVGAIAEMILTPDKFVQLLYSFEQQPGIYELRLLKLNTQKSMSLHVMLTLYALGQLAPASPAGSNS